MTNSIWNKYDIKDTPDENKLVVLVDKDDGFYNAHFVDKIDWINDWYNHIEKWCYVDELLAQADKAERLQKAVDLAIQRLEQGKQKFGKSTMGPNKEIAMLCDIVIDEIKQLIK